MVGFLMGFRLLSLGLFAALCAWANGAAASDNAQTAKKLTPTDVKAFEDWQILCLPDQKPIPCEMFQDTMVKENGVRISRVALGYAPDSNRFALEIVVPLGLSLTRGLTLQSKSYSSGRLDYYRCGQDGCYVETYVDQEAVAKLAQDGDAAKIIVVESGGRNVELPVSLKGFAAAQTAMMELAREKLVQPERAASAQ